MEFKRQFKICSNTILDGVVTIQICPSKWGLLRELRLEALHNHPNVYAGSWGEESKKPEEYWTNLLSGQRAYFALIFDRDAVAFGGVFGSKLNQTAILTSFYIRLTFRGYGLSTLLFNATEQWAHLNEYRFARVYHRASNLTSKQMILNNGYQLKGRELKEWPDGPEEQYFYEKEVYCKKR